MNEENGTSSDLICKEANEFKEGLVCAASQFISNSAMQYQFAENAVQEVCDALAVAHGLSSDDVDSCIDVQIPKKVQGQAMTLTDVLDEDGIVLRAAKLCKNNGVLPYYIIGILAYALTTKDDSSSDVSIFKDYMRYYGLKCAISKFCGLKLEPELRQLIADQYGKISEGLFDAPEKIALMKRAYNGGFTSEKNIMGCAQCTLLTMFQIFGRKNEVLFKSASGLSAGIGLSGDGVCGGYSGGVLYMGSIVGRRLSHLEDGDIPDKIMSFRMAQMLRDRFIDTFGGVICSDVHQAIFGRSFCLRTSVVKNEFEAAGAHTTKCTAVIGTVCAWLAEIIYDCGYDKIMDN